MSNRTPQHRLFDKWWETVGQHTPMGNTDEQVWDAGFQAATDFWHKQWHKDYGIPCDFHPDRCPLAELGAIDAHAKLED